MTKIYWIESSLVNDETSTDKEMKENFLNNGLCEEEANFYLNQRNEALKNPLNFEIELYEG